jgi:hypothetical protein
MNGGKRDLIKLSPKERKVYDMLLSGARTDVAAVNLKMSDGEFRVLKTGMRRKIANAEAFLEFMKQAYPYLYPKKEYKGIVKPKRRR